MKWFVHLSIWGLVARMVCLCSAADLPPQVKTALPPSKWVRECEWSMPTNVVPAEKSEGTRYLLYEKQDNPGEKERFVRVIRLMENATGVQDAGSLTFDFDPGFQQLILHRVMIHRGGKVMDQLSTAKIKIIQQESDLGEDIFTGKQSAVVFVEDLRVGDALEYAYTIRGENPALGGHYAARLTAQSSVPLDRQRLRLVWTSPRPLSVRADGTSVSGKKEPLNGGADYTWDYTGLEAVTEEDNLPEDFDPYPALEFSDFRDWSDVVNWALPLYAVEKTNPPPELADLIAKWQRNSPADKEMQARHALEFVQDEMRYTGIELGPDSYKPTHPYDTFRLRYGDCKGKSSLLCTILREMNIEAHPALVDSDGRNMEGRLPSPFAFDHCIVKMLLDGKVIWVDPTESYQGGSLWNRHVARLGKALVIQPGVTGLEEIPFPPPDNASQQVTATFRLKDYDSPAELTVKTVFQGSEADYNREYFARNNRKEILKNYVNYYARYYPDISEAAPLEVEDSRGTNLMIVTEHYQIANFWKTNTTRKQLEADFYGDSLDRRLTDPDVRVRKMPLRVSYPMKQDQDVIVHLPDSSWDVPSLEKKVEDDAFSFQYRRSSDGSTVRFHYGCETRAAKVPVARVAGYLKNRDEVSRSLDDELYRSFKEPAAAALPGLNWLMIVVAVLAFCGTVVGCAGIWWFTRVRTVGAGGAMVPPVLEDARLQGLGGWLILVGIGLCFAPFVRIAGLAHTWTSFFSMSTWQLVAVPTGGKYNALYAPLLIFELLGNMALLGLNVLAICMFFAKRKAFPKVYISLLMLNLAFMAIDDVVSSRIPSTAAGAEDSTAFTRTALVVALWCAYMVKSRRVKATFVR